MVSRAVVAVLVVACGCGRLGFDGNSDGGVRDGAFIDADPDAAAGFESLCDRPGMIFCESFEDDANVAKWTARNRRTGSVPVISPLHPYQGNRSLLTQVMAESDESFFRRTDDRLDNTPDLYARVWVYLPGQMTDHVGHANIVTLQSPMEGFSILALDDETAAYSDPTLGFQIGQFPTYAPRDEWFCMELQVHKDKNAGWVKATLNLATGPISAEKTGVDTDFPSPMEVDLGIAFSGPTQTSTLHMFIDNAIVTSGDVIGCYP